MVNPFPSTTSLDNDLTIDKASRWVPAVAKNTMKRKTHWTSANYHLEGPKDMGFTSDTEAKSPVGRAPFPPGPRRHKKQWGSVKTKACKHQQNRSQGRKTWRLSALRLHQHVPWLPTGPALLRVKLWTWGPQWPFHSDSAWQLCSERSLDWLSWPLTSSSGFSQGLQQLYELQVADAGHVPHRCPPCSHPDLHPNRTPRLPVGLQSLLNTLSISKVKNHP